MNENSSGDRLLKRTATVGQMTLLSRVLGFIRDVTVAAIFGASDATDAFFVAFRIPNFFRRLFAEGAFSQAFVPVLTAHKSTDKQVEVRQLVDVTATWLGGALLFIVAAGIVAAPFVIAIFAPGFVEASGKYELAASLLRMTFPYLLFISLTALLGGVLNTYGYFALPAFTPTLLNIALIFAALCCVPYFDEPVYALAWGVLLGGVLQFGVQLVATARIGFLPRLRFAPRHPGARRIMRLMAPALFGVSVAQLNLLVDTLMASYLQSGSISWLYYSDRLMEFPVGIFGVALGTVLLPALSEHYARRDDVAFSATIDWALRWLCVVTFPAAVGLAVLAVPMLSTLFQYRAFEQFDVLMSARSLIAYAVGLSGFVLVKILAPGYFSRQDTKTPVKVAVVALLVNVILNLLLIGPLAHAGLALATAIAALVNGGLLLFILRRERVYTPRAGWRRFLFQVSCATTVMGILLYAMSAGAAVWGARSALERAMHLGLLIALGAAAYGLVLIALGLRLQHLLQPRERAV